MLETVSGYLFTLIVEPLRLLFEFVFFWAYSITHNAGLSIVFLSLVINILLLPLYLRAERIEKQQNAKKRDMKCWCDKIKASFTGDERIMMLQAYYRECNYKPADVFKESISLFLQIPFFIAAYSYLSNLNLLSGCSLWLIKDLGLPDSLICIGDIRINLLPVLMTAINIIAGFLYSDKKGSIKDKLKLILLALVFLVLLYNSPAGLVFYWTLNNLFSLLKNLVANFINKRKFSKSLIQTEPVSSRNDMVLIYLSCSVLAVLTGFVIPAGIVSQSPMELTNTFITDIHSPALYLVNSTLTAIGAFMIWIPIFIYLIKGKHSKKISYAFVSFALIGMINAFLFNKDFGLLSGILTYEYPMSFQIKEIVINFLADVAIASIVYFVGYKMTKYIKPLISILLISSVFMGSTFGYVSYKNYDSDLKINAYDDISVPLTSTGENVIVIMMDRMIGAYLPYIFDEHPEIKEQFDGFTYYPNTISFGSHTNTGAPALFGGYEYTPERINSRSDELLVDKHNEALQLLPTIFSKNGWRVTVGDQPYANYKWLFDTSLYDENDNINAYTFSLSIRNELTDEAGADLEEHLNRNFFCYGLMRTLPYFIQPLVYSDGTYNHFYSVSLQNGQPGVYLREELALESLIDLTEITDESQNCFFIYSNQLTHADDLNDLSEKKYDEPLVVDNVPMYMDDIKDYKHFYSNTEACILLGNYFDYLRMNNVYDNTRIIIVADHGQGLNNFDDLLVMDLGIDAEWYNPILMVKDFNQTGFTTSNEFMTNADTPFLAVNGIFENPCNPFTNAPITDEGNKESEQYIYCSDRYNVLFNNGTQFKDTDGYWLVVHDNIWDDENWSFCEGGPS